MKALQYRRVQMRKLKGILLLRWKDRFYTPPLPYPTASRDVALKSKQEQKAKTIQQKGFNLLLCARMCDRADIRRAEGLKTVERCCQKISSDTPPIFPYRDTEGEEAQTCHYRCRYFLTPPSRRATSPIFCVTKRRGGVCESTTIPQGIGEGVKGHSPFEMEEQILHSSPTVPTASRDVALKSKQEQKAKTIQQKGINLLCARMCDRGGARRAEGLKNRRTIVPKDFTPPPPAVPRITRSRKAI